MPENKQYLNNLMQSLLEDNFAKAKDDLQSAITEKLKDRMKTEMDAQSNQTASKKLKGE